MKNIHVLPANKPSSLYFSGNNSELLFLKGHIFYRAFGISPQNIYITSDEEIKGGDWVYCLKEGFEPILKQKVNPIGVNNDEMMKKIILTDNKDLIKDGVQAIDDEFLEWFVKNPSCERVEIVFNNRGITGAEKTLKTFGDYKIIIPKEEPKQETLEEAAIKNCESITHPYCDREKRMFIKGAEWQQEQICTSEFIQRIRATKSDAEARRIIREQFKNK